MVRAYGPLASTPTITSYRTLTLQKEQETFKIRSVHSEGEYLCIAILHDVVIHTGVVLVFPHIDAYMITYQAVLLYPVQQSKHFGKSSHLPPYTQESGVPGKGGHLIITHQGSGGSPNHFQGVQCPQSLR